MGLSLSLPFPVLEKINSECSSHTEKIAALAIYILTIIPGISWEGIAIALYREDEERALERARPYLHIIPGESNAVKVADTLYVFILLTPSKHTLTVWSSGL